MKNTLLNAKIAKHVNKMVIFNDNKIFNMIMLLLQIEPNVALLRAVLHQQALQRVHVHVLQMDSHARQVVQSCRQWLLPYFGSFANIYSGQS